MPLRVWVVCGVLAFLAGTLFNLSHRLGIAALRMPGVWSLVAIGLIVAREAGRAQAAEARRRLREILEGLGPDHLVVEAGPALWAVVAPGGVLALTLDAMAQYGRGPLAQRRLERAVREAARAGAAVRAALAGMVDGEEPPRVQAALVLLRRRAPTADAGGGAGRSAAGAGGGPPPIVNPEGVPPLAQPLAVERLDAATRERVAGALAAGVVALRPDR